jgi:RimJ/RimL family protein N-acetyltransferase
MDPRIETERLVLRPWTETDVWSALEIYGDEQVTRWLTPAMDRVLDEPGMRAVLAGWKQDVAPAGHWAIELRDTGQVVGGVAMLRLAPWEDLEVGWQLARQAWGNGYAAEAGVALIDWTMHHADVDEVFALVSLHNDRAAATAKRMGMELIGETDQYHHNRLNLYRIRHYDLPFHESP